jgi:DNA-binding NarL/FixJ family response regulator
LGDEAYAAALEEGRSMTTEQAIALQEPAQVPDPQTLPNVQAFLPHQASAAVIPPAPAPLGLTRRELDVLRLLAEGLSNAQIGERLVISPRTVDNHLVSIYSKLHVSSRTAAVRSAREQHLL